MDCPATIVIDGAGDIGSAMAVFAFRQGCRVVIPDEAQPAWTRRGMAFTDVFFDDAAELCGVLVRERAKVIRSTVAASRRLASALVSGPAGSPLRSLFSSELTWAFRYKASPNDEICRTSAGGQFHEGNFQAWRPRAKP